VRPYSLAVFVAASIAEASSAAVFGVDDRHYVSTASGSPYSPVGLVRVGGQRATGTLINRCDVLTVQHVYGRYVQVVHDPRGERASFEGSVASGHPLSSKGTIIAAGGWRHLKPSSSRFNDDLGSDWMIIRLDECIGDKLGWAMLGTSTNQPTKTDPKHLQSAGFPLDRSDRSGLSVDSDCMIRGVAQRVLLHDCATTPGNSGGPIFRLVTIDGVQRMEIVGIVSAASSFEHDPVAVRGDENLATASWNVRYEASQ
jgi:V8-like Glu-specific endopeptidase